MYKNGFFQMATKNDGIYVKIFPAINGGEPLQFDEVSRYLTSKRVMDYDIKKLHDGIMHATKPIEIKISNELKLPESESVRIEITPDKMKAIGRFYPPSSGGSKITKEEIIADLTRSGVKYGILEDDIDKFLMNRRYCTNIILAKGLETVKGEDAVITYHFNVNKNAKPKENKDGSVDFHQLDIISKVQKGDILATLSPVKYGVPGMNVLGTKINPDKVINRVIRYSSNATLSEDGCILYSDVSGHVKLEHDKVVVSNVYEVNGNVDTSTGDINYDGNVRIKGNVITGYTVRAKGDIEVDGVVEGATLIADGQIILKRGVQGMNRGKLVANGNIVAKFIESCEVRSGSSVMAGAILHSKVAAKSEINVNGRNGSVTGGELRAGYLISVKVVGSTMGTHTALIVGVDPLLIDELHTLEKDIPKKEEEREQMLKAITLLQKKLDSGVNLSPERQQQLTIALKNSIMLDEALIRLKARYEELKIIVENTEGGKVKVSNIAYPGVKITITNIIYFVRSEQHYCQFLRDGADIVVKPY